MQTPGNAVALAQAAALVSSAASSLARASPPLEVLLPAIDWQSDAARAFHVEAEALREAIDALRADTVYTAGDAEDQAHRAAVAVVVALPGVGSW
jgi:hypothetical protein